MSKERTVAWAGMRADGTREINAASGPVRLPPEGSAPSLTGLELAAAAIAADLLDAFVHVSRQLAMSWSSVEGEVTLERGDHPRRVSRIDYQLRVVSAQSALADIAEHELEAEAVVLASFVAAERSGHIVVVAPERAN